MLVSHASRLLVGVRSVHTSCAKKNEVILRVTENFLPFAVPVASDCAKRDADTQAAVATIESRQELHKLPAMFALERTRCRHGFPRAFVQLPVHRNEDNCPDMELPPKDESINSRRGGPTVHSTIIRLSCPHLVKAVDEFEYEGKGVERMNSILNETESNAELDFSARTHNAQPTARGPLTQRAQDMVRHFEGINDVYRGMKDALMDGEQRQMVAQRLGNETIEHFMQGGICSISPGKEKDVKCFHAHVADALLRGTDANMFGAWALQRMQEEKGIDPSGCDNCWQQCDKNFVRTKDSFWYVSNKNSKGLQQKKERKAKQIDAEKRNDRMRAQRQPLHKINGKKPTTGATGCVFSISMMRSK